MALRTHLIRALALGGAIAAAACDEAEPDTAITLDFRGVVDGQPFECGREYAGIGTSKSSFEPLDFRLYLHDFAVITPDGESIPVEPVEDGRWQRDGFVLLDFEDGSAACETGSPGTHTSIDLFDATASEIAAIAFSIGLPEGDNHLDAATAPAPLNEPGMWWSWRGGYKYVRADIRTASGEPYYFHLGSTSCEGTPATGFACSNANIPRITIEGMDPENDRIDVDLARLYNGVDIDVVPDYATDFVAGCMAFSGDPECPDMFGALGLGFESAPPPSAPQSMFSAQEQP
jgi:uncharacterized repeat protein (TIGR04052 family)